MNGRVSDAATLEWIKLYISRKGYPPTVREVARGLGLVSTSTAFYHIEKLVKQGHIRRDPGIARSIVVVAA